MTTQEAIEQLQTEHDLIATERDIDGSQFAPALLEALAMAIEALNNSEIPNGSDCISRQAAIDALDEYFERIGKLKRRGLNKGEKAISLDTVGAIKSLPSAQPEREKGKWTKDCACEICGFKPWYERDIHTLSFCPNCGADMRGEQE